MSLGKDENKTEAILKDIINESSLFDKKETKVVRTLTAIKNELTKVPVDFYEWRVMNIRLMNFWILPLSMSPRSLLIWARFVDADPSIELINDEIDEIPIYIFWVYWLISPSALLCKILHKFNTHTFLDEMLDWVFHIRALYEIVQFIFCCFNLYAVHLVVQVIALLNNSSKTEEDRLNTRQLITEVKKADTSIVGMALLKQAGIEIKYFLVAQLFYYGLYFVIPSNYWDSIFAIYVYILKPWDLIRMGIEFVPLVQW